MASTVCAICLRSTKESIAIKFCSDCEEAICGDCVRVHGTIKALSNHHIIDITLANDHAFTVHKICTQHSEMILELYCSDHDILCCRSCMADHHRTCEKLLPIDVAAKDIKRSTMLKDIAECIRNLNKTADELENQDKCFGAILHESQKVVMKRVSVLKAKLLQRITEMETQILSEVESIFATLLNKTKNNRKHIDNCIKDIKEISSRFDFVINHGSESQIFHALHSTKLNINETGKSIEEFITSWKSTEIVFNESDLLSVMKTFGSISVTEKPCNIQYKQSKIQQAQILQTSRIIKKLKLEKTVSIPCTGQLKISGIAVTKDNRLILCDQSSKGLIVLTEDGQRIKNVILHNYPFGIVAVPEADEAWVTVPMSRRVQIINTVTYSTIRQVVVQFECYGITMFGNDVALGGCKGKVNIINKQGVRLKELNIGSDTGEVHSICVRCADRLYCCAANEEKFICIKLDGTIEFSYSFQQRLGPIGVTTDARGNVYVLGWRSHSLHRFSADGKCQEIMLTSTDGLNTPYTFAFNRKNSKIFISNYDDNTLRIFSCI